MDFYVKIPPSISIILSDLMSKMIFCKKLNIEAPALSKAPFPGELGERIFNEISETAWQMWLGQQTMLINEYRLNLIDPQARAFLRQEMQKFFFEGGSEPPPGYQAEKS
jgi:Fe-S cluster biosynthesis and repair protein YggX